MRTHQIYFLTNSHLSKTGCSPFVTYGAMNLVDSQQIRKHDVMLVLD